MQDKKQFAKNLIGLAELFGKTLTKNIIDVYWRILQKYPDDAIQFAIGQAARTFKKFPLPAELLEVLEGSALERSALAWSQVMQAIPQIGAYSVPKFEDLAIERAIQGIGGWRFLCTQTPRDLGFIGQRFRELYAVFHQRGDHPKCLPGVFVQPEMIELKEGR